MKKVIVIALVLFIGGFLAFLDLEFETGTDLGLIESYKPEIEYSSYTAERIISTHSEGEGLRITYVGCQIDTSNIKGYGELSERLAKEINEKVNESDQFENIMLIFKPSNSDDIKINSLISIDELKYDYTAIDL